MLYKLDNCSVQGSEQKNSGRNPEPNQFKINYFKTICKTKLFLGSDLEPGTHRNPYFWN